MPRCGVQISESACPAEDPTSTHLRQPGRYEAGQRIPLIGERPRPAAAPDCADVGQVGRVRSVAAQVSGDRNRPHLDQRNIGVDPLLRADALCEGCGTSYSSKRRNPMTDTLDHAASVLADAVIEDDDAGVYRANRRIFTDEDIFELEMKHIFEGNWVYLAHETQMPNPGDYFTTYIGRQPVVITRDRGGKLNCLINACSHRGAMLCRRKTDNRTTLTCPFHGWTFRNDGTLLKVKDPEGAGYPDAFNQDGSHDLTKVRFDSYRGFLFGSINDDVVPLAEHLGDSTKVIDLLVDQSPDGLEVLRGSSTYTYDGNWKVQAENGADGYHVSAVHWNYAATTSRRGTGESANVTKTLDAGGWGKSGGGYWSFPHGHLCLWTYAANPQDRPLWDRLRRAQGDVRRRQGRLHGEGLPQPVPVPERLPDGSVQHADPAFPADCAPNKTEVTIYCIAPKGESARGPRATGSASTRTSSTPRAWPRPTTSRNSARASSPSGATKAPWNDMSRGAKHWLNGTERPRHRARHGRGDLVGNQERGRGPLPGAAPVLARDHARRFGRRQPFRLRRIR